MMSARSLIISAAALASLAGCGGGSGSGGGDGSGGPGVTDHGPEGGFFTTLPGGAAQLAKVCARKSHDAVAAHFCTAAPSGCAPGDLLTPAVEKQWRSVSLYEDEDLKNTVFDCRHCHQPNGPSTAKMLRMQERRAPWTHWFRNNANEPGGVTLVQDFQTAHGKSEDYAGIPAELLDTPRS